MDTFDRRRRLHESLWPNSEASFEELDYAHISSYAHVLADEFPQFVKVSDSAHIMILKITHNARA